MPRPADQIAGSARNRNIRGIAPSVVAALILAVSATLPAFAQSSQPATTPAADDTPRISAKLYAAHESIRPGEETELAIEITVPEKWHIYHPIILATGAPTTVDFAVPPGVTFGPLRFPAPEYVAEDVGGLVIDYLGLRGRVVVLTTVKVAKDYAAKTLPMRATVAVLVCKEACVPAEAQATLQLPISSEAPKAAHEALFREAREALPRDLAHAEYIEKSGIALDREQVTLDDPAEVVLTVNVRSGHHIQDRNPGNDSLVASRLFIETVDGIKLGEQQWAEPSTREVPFIGKVREQHGAFKVRVPLSINDLEFASGPVTLRALFQYQCCTDAGSCYPPETAYGLIQFNADTPNAKRPADAAVGTWMPLVKVVDYEKLTHSIGAGTADTTKAGAQAGAAAESHSLWYILVLSFLGGLILNIMPCVFPVISIKILSFVKQAGEDRGRVFRLGLAFCAGIMVWFWIFAVLTGLGEIPWQYPPVVIGLTAVLFAFALNLFGVFEITLPGSAAGKLDEASRGEGYTGAFMKGLLATLLGTACTAPFFATAAAFAATKPLVISLAIFTGAGLGMSSPYLLLSAFPAWLKLLPKPGAWMVTFKQAMGFVLVGTAIWLLLVVGDMLGAHGVVWTVAFLSFLAFALWLIGRIKLSWSSYARLQTWGLAAVVVLFGWWFSLDYMFSWRAAVAVRTTDAARTYTAEELAAIASTVRTADWQQIPWQEWHPGLPEALARAGYPVYVDFTATWCATCLTNKASSLETDSTRAALRELGVIPLEGDFTLKSPTIHKELLKFERNTVPLNLVYAPVDPGNPLVLPYVLTPGTVQDALHEAGASTGTDVAARTEAAAPAEASAGN